MRGEEPSRERSKSDERVDHADIMSNRALRDTSLMIAAVKNKKPIPRTLEAPVVRETEKGMCTAKCLGAENTIQSCPTSCIANDTKKIICKDASSNAFTWMHVTVAACASLVLGIFLGSVSVYHYQSKKIYDVLKNKGTP